MGKILFTGFAVTTLKSVYWMFWRAELHIISDAPHRKNSPEQNLNTAMRAIVCGQSMLKMNFVTGEISVVMTNRNPEVDQSESGVELLTEL